MTPDTANIACRFAFDAASLFLWGSAAYLWLLVPEGLRASLWARLGPWRIAAVALAVTATLALLPVRCAMLGNGWADGLDRAIMAAVLTGTSIGAAWAWQALSAALLLAVTLLPLRQKPAATAIAGALMLCGLALTGHAAMNDCRGATTCCMCLRAAPGSGRWFRWRSCLPGLAMRRWRARRARR
jgi:putative copper resistance protein D